MLAQEGLMDVSKIMHRDVQIIGPEESLQNAAAMMKNWMLAYCQSVNMISWSA